MNLVTLIVLLTEMGMSLSAWLGIVITAMIGVLSYLLTGAYTRLLKDIDENRSDITEIRKDFNEEKLSTANRMKDLKIVILESLNDIKEDFYELRK